MNIGYSFDIQDDIIDTFAQEQQYGKPLGRDITLGRKPLHILYALNSSNRDGSKTLRSFMGKQDISHEEMNKIRTLIRQNSARASNPVSTRYSKFNEISLDLIIIPW